MGASPPALVGESWSRAVWRGRSAAATVRGLPPIAMKSILTIPVLLLSLSAFAAPAMAQQDATAAAKAAPKVGVVDFVKVVDAYPRAIEARAKIEELRKQQRGVLEAELKKGKELEVQLEDLQRGTPAHDLKLHELRLKKQNIEGMEQIFDREWRRKIDEFYTTIYSDLERAVAIVAKERGVLMVLRAHPQLEDGSLENKSRVFEARIVWYAAEEIDLTPAVIKLLQVPLPAEAKPDSGKPEAPKPAGETKLVKTEQRN